MTRYTEIVHAVVAAGTNAIDDIDAQELKASRTDCADALIDELLAMLKALISDQKRRIELERADASRMTLELAASALERLSGNESYQRAYIKAAKLLRE